MERPSGQRARTCCPSGTCASPALRYSTAAQATMSPLSVHSLGGGTSIRHELCTCPSAFASAVSERAFGSAGAAVASQSAWTRRRSSELAATPPDKTSVFGATPQTAACVGNEKESVPPWTYGKRPALGLQNPDQHRSDYKLHQSTGLEQAHD
eukprot:6174671-Pleurochrysis_carterae.AAC.2